MNTLHTKAVVSGIPADTVLSGLLEHLAEHDMVARTHDGGWVLDYDDAEIWFGAQADTLRAEIKAPSHEALFDARMMAHHHIAEFAHCELDAIQWEGDQPAFERPPAFRILTVAAIEELSPHLRRVRFNGENLARYDTDEDIHCKLLIPQPGVTDPEWPSLAADGLPQMPTGEKRLDMRTYTIRRIDGQAGWMEIDFVLHDDAGPGAAWAAAAAVGSRIGVSGPGGRTAQPADWMLLAADETGLPAIARIAEKLPAHIRGEIIIEVQNSGEELNLNVPTGMKLRWLHRGDKPPGTGTQLRDAILAVSIPAEGDRYAWVAAEFSTAQEVRAWLRNTVGLTAKEQLVVAYWRLGMDETRMKSGGKSPARTAQAEKAEE